MDINKFLENLAEILEVDKDSINLDTNFRNDIKGWDSLKGFSIIVFLKMNVVKQLLLMNF